MYTFEIYNSFFFTIPNEQQCNINCILHSFNFNIFPFSVRLLYYFSSYIHAPTYTYITAIAIAVFHFLLHFKFRLHVFVCCTVFHLLRLLCCAR